MKQIKLLYNMNKILGAEEETKKIKEYTDVDTFLNHSVLCKEIAENIPVLKDIFNNQIHNNLGIQSCIVYETVLIASLAKYYNMNYNANAPRNNNIRYVYEGERGFIHQQGNPNTVDCEMLVDGVHSILEVKKPIARAGDGDIKTTADGYLIGRESFPEELNAFLSTINVLSYKGHNIPITRENAVAMATNYLHNINYILTITEKGNNLVIIDVPEIVNYITFKGSEIRTTGKNWVKTKTMADYLKRYIIEHNGQVIDNKAIIPKDILHERTKQRGGNSLSAWRKIDYFFRIKDCYIIEEDKTTIVCSFKDIEQTNPNVSAHLNIYIPEVEV